MRNRPLRSRSVRMIDETAGCPSAPSPARGATAIGLRCAPPPVISIVSCADATPATQVRPSRSQRDSKDPPRLFLPAILFVLRPEAKFQLAHEELRVVGLGQRLGPEDGAVHRLVVRGVAARATLPHGPRQYLAGRQHGD